jgi:predicted NAD/FAD-binding protein
MFRFFQRSRERYMATSTNSRRVLAPAGASHQFVYEHPDFVIATMREAVRRDL